MLIRRIVIGMAVLGCLLGPARAEELSLVGGGVIMAQSPYRGVGTKTTPVPMLLWDYKNVYVKGVEVGYHVYKTQDLTLNVLVVPRFMGYRSKDSDALSGMHDRKSSLDIGVSASYVLSGLGGLMLNGKALADVAGRHHGQVAELGVSRKFRSKFWFLTPSLGARFQTSPLVDYYYGVETDEVRVDRPAYDPGAAVNYFADVMLNFGIHPKWIVTTKLNVEFLDREIRQSPLVGKDYLVTGIIGLSRRF